jgi:predicted polyphosphate/ATP-dependent NAD kinase
VKFGFVLNPFAGMGGSVGLKGTDGPALDEAVARGAKPKAVERARLALGSAGDLRMIELYTVGGPMGSDLLVDMDIAHEVVYAPPEPTKGKDTTEAVRLFCAIGCDLVIFCGGDGTARDVMEGIEGDVPCIGVPSGVKMHSGVFANSPRDAGTLIREFIRGSMNLRRAEVMDIDEDMFREGILSARLIGHLTVLDDPALVQPSKGSLSASGDEEEKEEVGAYLASIVEEGTTYVLGPGTTVEAFAKEMGVEKTLLGVDVMRDGVIVMKDAGEKEILAATKGRKFRIVVTPIGSQGFIFGRGNQQISPAVIRSAGRESIMIIATPGKLRGLRCLKTDTGDEALDDELAGHWKVIIGFGRERMMRLGGVEVLSNNCPM